MKLEKGASDEVLVLGVFGIQICIFELIDYINNNFEKFCVSECATEKLLGLNRADGIDGNTIKNMNGNRICQPLLAATIDDDEWIIDGNHRLLKRSEMGKKNTSYIEVPGAVLGLFITEL